MTVHLSTNRGLGDFVCLSPNEQRLPAQNLGGLVLTLLLTQIGEFVQHIGYVRMGLIEDALSHRQRTLVQEISIGVSPG